MASGKAECGEYDAAGQYDVEISVHSLSPYHQLLLAIILIERLTRPHIGGNSLAFRSYFVRPELMKVERLGMPIDHRNVQHALKAGI